MSEFSSFLRESRGILGPSSNFNFDTSSEIDLNSEAFCIFRAIISGVFQLKLSGLTDIKNLMLY